MSRDLTEGEKWLESRGYKIGRSIKECASHGIRWKGGNMFDRTPAFYGNEQTLDLHKEDSHLNLPERIHDKPLIKGLERIKLYRTP